MRLELATASDDQAVKQFYESFPLHGPMEILVKRPKSFFDYYKLQSDDFDTYVLRNSRNQIQGCATVVFREGQILGQPTKIGYATDLRIASNRAAIIGWARHFLPVIRSAAKKRHSQYLFSMLSGYDATVYNALVRPRAQRRNIPIYHLVRKFDIVCIVGHLPFLYKKLQTLRLAPAEPKDMEALADYLKRKSSNRALSFPYSTEFLIDRFKRWPDFSLSSFILAKDGRGNIVGTAAPWSSSSIQSLFPIRYSMLMDTARRAMKIGSWLKLTNPLPTTNRELRVNFVTHLFADNPDIFEALLEEGYRRTPPGSFLAYNHFQHYPLTRPLTQFLHVKVPASLYAISPIEDELPRELLHNPLDTPPELELCLV